MNTYLKDALALFIAIAISQLAGIIGSFFTFSSVDTWYTTIAQPALTPPDWIFGPVWTTLYALIGIAVFMVWKQRHARPDVSIAFIAFGVQLVLNALWSILFFGLQNPMWALIDLIALWLAIVWTMYIFARFSKWAVYLLIPYLAWVSFAGYLNYMFWILN